MLMKLAMFGLFFKLVPTLRWPTPLVHDVNHDKVAIDNCISAVQIYFPYESTTPTNYTSLCEQYLWRVACYDDHASTPSSHPDRATIEMDMHAYCRVAGSVDATKVQRQYHAQRRQINSILSSIGGEISSFLSSASVTIVLPSLASRSPVASVAPSAFTTPPASAVQSMRSSVSTPVAPASSARSSVPTPTRSLTQGLATSSNSDVSQSIAQSTSSPRAASISSTRSRPSAGLIAGVVIGSVAVLVLFGILLMLVLRHKRKKTSTKTSAAENGEGNVAVYRGEPSVETITAEESIVGDEKTVYQSREPPSEPPPLPRENEMPTSANVWELDARERPPPVELEAGNTYIPYKTPDSKSAHLPVGHEA
ncbi:uncharacterized protein K460DRAFT_133199 [Cucurbitaria berberidis CBS 394.84]|uniref:Mid2 domain-containing protein n=1 Tax=Cucurbitaria berberidis CBS 394.84 TaxID=1168544 RepID=A0A9P4L644_9PLEO|nr:uncharacterized protein K460DRAFT_133199 [Cucurbitaria berberidis CBS 394.84]KAF1842693.1 hypothetical protein K460DRAFT_133199 [Cucurbitaria berberidis CBS 394.84]